MARPEGAAAIDEESIAALSYIYWEEIGEQGQGRGFSPLSTQRR